ncbi:MAG: DUF5658 family protein [Thermoguttaceae bacterium]
MGRLIVQALRGLIACVLLLAGEIVGQETTSPESVEEDVVRGETIASGYVILEGRYLPPPYLLEKHGDDLWINGELAVSDWFRWPWGVPPPEMFPRGGWGGRGFSSGGPTTDGDRRMPDRPRERDENRVPGGTNGRHGPFGPDLSRLEKALKSGWAIVAGQELRACVLTESDLASLVQILTSAISSEEKRDQIRAEVPGHLGTWKWHDLIASFEPSEALSQRLAPELERIQKVLEDNQRSHEAAVASVFWTSKPVKYVITLAAMGLVVAACGTLLNYRPTGRGRWSEIDASGDGTPIVVRSVVLLILLGIFDLGCTLVAQEAGGLTEMNPFGSQLVENPLLLTAFKLTTLLGACGILYGLRRYRGAQVAAWWMCLLCTVLTFRWLTYNSMFMS